MLLIICKLSTFIKVKFTVYTGNLQWRFGEYRQACGSNHNVLSSQFLKLKRLKLSSVLEQSLRACGKALLSVRDILSAIYLSVDRPVPEFLLQCSRECSVVCSEM